MPWHCQQPGQNCLRRKVHLSSQTARSVRSDHPWPQSEASAVWQVTANRLQFVACMGNYKRRVLLIIELKLDSRYWIQPAHDKSYFPLQMRVLSKLNNPPATSPPPSRRCCHRPASACSSQTCVVFSWILVIGYYLLKIAGRGEQTATCIKVQPFKWCSSVCQPCPLTCDGHPMRRSGSDQAECPCTRPPAHSPHTGLPTGPAPWTAYAAPRELRVPVWNHW